MSAASKESLDVDLFRVRQLGDALISQLGRLRDQEPVFWSDSQQIWIITGHEQVAEAFKPEAPFREDRMPRVFSYFPREDQHKIPNIVELFPKFLINIDPPDHLRLRKLMMRAFSRRISESFRPASREIVATTLDQTVGRDTVDVVDEVGMRIAGRLILKLMGLPDALYPKMREWGIAVSRGLGAGGAAAVQVLDTERAFQEMRELFQREIELRRASPQPDFIGELVNTEENGDRLTDEEIIATCILTIIAGHDTTANTIVLSAVCIAKHPEILSYIRDHPAQIDDIGMELMRIIAMSTAQFRVVARDATWFGKELKQGQNAWLVIAAANRDPSVFDRPEEIDFSRKQRANLVFAPGSHHCVGHFVARMQLSEFFLALADRVQRIDVLDDPLDWDTPLSFRGLRTLNAHLVAADGGPGVPSGA